MGLHKANQTSFKKGHVNSTAWYEAMKKMTPWNKGNSEAMSREKSPRWKGGLPDCKICFKQLSIRHSKTLMCKGCFLKSEEGRKHSASHLPAPMKGKNHPNWKGGVTSHDRIERVKFSRTMQKLIFERDDYMCQLCGATGDLQVDHIQSWSEYVELRFSMDNCRTLCAKCHYEITFKRPMPSNIKGWGHNLLKGGTHL